MTRRAESPKQTESEEDRISGLAGRPSILTLSVSTILVPNTVSNSTYPLALLLAKGYWPFATCILYVPIRSSAEPNGGPLSASQSWSGNVSVPIAHIAGCISERCQLNIRVRILHRSELLDIREEAACDSIDMHFLDTVFVEDSLQRYRVNTRSVVCISAAWCLCCRRLTSTEIP
jgi:hypothetical protein